MYLVEAEDFWLDMQLLRKVGLQRRGTAEAAGAAAVGGVQQVICCCSPLGVYEVEAEVGLCWLIADKRAAD